MVKNYSFGIIIQRISVVAHQNETNYEKASGRWSMSPIKCNTCNDCDEYLFSIAVLYFLGLGFYFRSCGNLHGVTFTVKKKDLYVHATCKNYLRVNPRYFNLVNCLMSSLGTIEDIQVSNIMCCTCNTVMSMSSTGPKRDP